jgi:hypothetical protein
MYIVNLLPKALARSKSAGSTSSLPSRSLRYGCCYQALYIRYLVVEQNKVSIRKYLYVHLSPQLFNAPLLRKGSIYRIVEFLLWETTINNIHHSLQLKVQRRQPFKKNSITDIQKSGTVDVLHQYKLCMSKKPHLCNWQGQIVWFHLGIQDGTLFVLRFFCKINLNREQRT